jgi:hypothetical protein
MIAGFLLFKPDPKYAPFLIKYERNPVSNLKVHTTHRISCN